MEGRLDKVHVAEFLNECRSAGTPLILDCDGLTSADNAGIEAIRSLAAEGAELRGLSLYFRQLLYGRGS